MVSHVSPDERYMRRALFHAQRGLGRTAPNPMVGAVIVGANGVVVGDGYHERAGLPHAEVNALDEAGALARGATLYVTLEPCCHTGRTGPCTRRVIDAGITRVVAAMSDPDPRVSGRGFDELRAHGVTVDVGLCEPEAQRLNQAFVAAKTMNRPLVLLKAAASLDARIAAGPGVRTPITSREANRKSQTLRASIDAIAVGSETVLVDDPLLTARECYRERPLCRVVFDRRLRISASARLFSTLDQGPLVIFTSESGHSDARAQALERAGAQICAAASLREALAQLVARDVATLLVEGGPTLQHAFVRDDLIDRVHLVVSPRTLGAKGIPWLDVQTLVLPPATALRAEPRGIDIWIEADVHRDR